MSGSESDPQAIGSSSAPLDEQLTAYLDGELSATECAQLETRLVEEEPLRRRLAELRQAYEFLDELPDTPHKQSFTQSTIAMVVEEVKRASPQTTSASKGVPVPPQWLQHRG